MNNPIPTLSDGQSDALRKNLMALLAAQAGRYTQGASGSLPKETMDELLVSALYTLSVDPTRPESYAPLVGQDILPAFFRPRPAFCKSATRRWRWLLPCVCAWTTWDASLCERRFPPC